MCIIINQYKKQLIHRYDDEKTIKYFTASDFKGLKYDDYSFKSNGNILKGKFYYYDGFDDNTFVVFCHGIGGGHLSYMTEIELLCKNGYKVFAYDNTGCFDSQGESIISLTESLIDLDNAINSLKDNGILNDKKLYLVGHSWGGYAVSNILNYQDGIDKIVDISGFTSVENFIKVYLKSLPKFAVNKILSYEKRKGGKYYNSNSVDALKDTDVNVLIAHSKDDPVISFDDNTGYIKSNLKNKNITFLICDDKQHNPNYTHDAITYMQKVLGEYNLNIKNHKLKTLTDKQEFLKDVDWERMTCQDDGFWKTVLTFLHD